MTRCEQVFKTELQRIEDPHIKAFTIECMTLIATDSFWTYPASTSGKYHPAISLGEGGLVRHTKLAVWLGRELAKAYALSRLHTDIVVAALILHDAVKNGPVRIPNSTALHGVWAAGRIRDAFRAGTVTWPEDRAYEDCHPVDAIIRAVGGHMGIWTALDQKYVGALFQPDEYSISMVVHLADYVASRKIPAEIARIQQEVPNDSETL